MFAKIFQKNTSQKQEQQQSKGFLTPIDLDIRITVHYGIPPTASIMAFDPIQRLMAIGTLDGRIKVIGGDNIEALLVSPKPLPFKNLEFLENQGVLATVSNENEIQVWDLEHRQITSTLQWESNITAFTVIAGTSYMYIGDEYGMVSVLKYDAGQGKLVYMPYYVPTDSITEASGNILPINQPVVGLLSQPSSQGNRVLIAYENGLIVLWDVSKDQVVLVRGNKDLRLTTETMTNSPTDTRHGFPDDEQVEKDICSLCWASTNGSILAVGYVDGDIMFWNLSIADSVKDQPTEKPSNNVVKLQLSSGSRRVPVIALHWSADSSRNNSGGQLFVYGGDNVGSEEVLTILSLDWSSGMESLKCVGRVDLTLNGSFADMVVSPSTGVMTSSSIYLMILSNPGKLHFYDDSCLAALMSQQEKKTSVSSVEFQSVILATEPYMTVGKLGTVSGDGHISRALSETVSAAKLHATQTPKTGSVKWPLTGGLPCELSSAKDYQIERIYIAGFQDGSVQIWDATCPSLSLIYAFGSEAGAVLQSVKSSGGSASISALDLCSFSLSLAVGNECGMVYLYKLVESSEQTEFCLVTETKKEVHTLNKGDGPQCIAVFSLLNSPVSTVQFANFGARLAIGFECGQVAMLDITSLSVLFVTNSISVPGCPVNYLTMKLLSDANSFMNSPTDSECKHFKDPEQWVVFAMTKDAHIIILDSTTGNIVSSQCLHPKMESAAISLYIIGASNEKQSSNSTPSDGAKTDIVTSDAHSSSNQLEVEPETSTGTGYFGLRLENLDVLICSENALCLYSLESLIQGESNSILKVDLAKPCCWTAMFRKEEKECGLVVLYQTGVFEIRSLPSLEVVGECSLASILRWNFKTNMERTMSSSGSGQISLVNGSELAFISLLASENDFRIPESLPCLHNKVLAAAVDATVNKSPSQRRTQGAGAEILGSIPKSINVGETEHHVHLSEVNSAHLESIFCSPPFLKPSNNTADNQEVVELNIDDIEIDGPLIVSSSPQQINYYEKEKKTEKERLFEGASSTAGTEPRMRTAEEIKAKYRKTGDASAAAEQAKNKLLERGEKLQRLNERTEELQSGAESFAAMANELAKRMEKHKWWQF